MRGLLDEVRLYDQDLSQAQIVADREGNYGGGPMPIAAYGFEEGSGLTVGDSAGSNNGTITGAATWTESGKYSSALSFDGVNDAVAIPDAAELDLTDTFTLEAWVRPGTLTSLVPVINKTENAFSGYGLLPAAGESPTGFVGNPSTVVGVIGEKAMSTTAWPHLAFTSDGTTLSLYVDGELVKTDSAVNAASSSDDLILGGPILIPPKDPQVGTWNTFTQWKVEGALAGCQAPDLGVPVSFGVRHYLAGAHTHRGRPKRLRPLTESTLWRNSTAVKSARTARKLIRRSPMCLPHCSAIAGTTLCNTPARPLRKVNQAIQ